MRERNLLFIILIFLLIFLVIIPSINADESNFEDKIDEYIHHLIFIYREKADHDTDFDVEKYEDDMYIYMKNTDSMRVLCFDGNVVNDSIIFVFDKNPFLKSSIGLEIEYLFDVDFYDYLPFYIPPNVSVYSKATFDLNYTLITPELIHCEPIEKIIYDTQYNSRRLAEEFYKHHKKSAKIDEIWNPFVEENADVIFKDNDSYLFKEWERIFTRQPIDNYSFNNFLNDFYKFEEDVLLEKNGIWYYVLYDGWVFTTFSFFMNLIILSIGLLIEVSYYGIKKYPKSTLVLETFFTFVYGHYVATDLNFNITAFQIIIPFIAIPLPYLFYRKFINKK